MTEETDPSVETQSKTSKEEAQLLTSKVEIIKESSTQIDGPHESTPLIVPPEANQRNSQPKRKNKKKNPERKRHGARNQHRHKKFVKWLVETFDLKPNNIEGHILDVAGGKGEVSARLCMCHRQNTVMVDPRKADLVKCYETLVYPKIPNKWQRRIDEKRKENPNFVKDTLEGRFQQLVTTFDEYSITDKVDLQDALENATLLLGLHADGATEAIVDAALKLNKPFVVVPCCVFPNFFTSRQVQNEDGKLVPVRSHEQFCKYLAAKDERLQIEELPFEGRNIAIWWNGISVKKSSLQQ
jgi:hypothetical protein